MGSLDVAGDRSRRPWLCTYHIDAALPWITSGQLRLWLMCNAGLMLFEMNMKHKHDYQ